MSNFEAMSYPVLRQSLEMQRSKMNMEDEEVLSMAAVGRYLV